MQYGINDVIYCRVNGSDIVKRTDNDFEAQLSFKIIGFDLEDNKYVILIPGYYSIKGRFHLNETQLNEYGIARIYLNKTGAKITDKEIVKVSKNGSADGMYCARCKHFFPMAEPNQPDGSMKCYQCRANPWR